MTPEKKAEYRKLAEEVMEPVLTVAARRLGQAVEEIHTSQIKPLRDEIERLRAQVVSLQSSLDAAPEHTRLGKKKTPDALEPKP
jgi:uncharacterized small protein (DUF1192 family)